MTKIKCENNNCNSTEFHINQFIHGEYTIICTHCGEKMPFSEEYEVYRDFIK